MKRIPYERNTNPELGPNFANRAVVVGRSEWQGLLDAVDADVEGRDHQVESFADEAAMWVAAFCRHASAWPGRHGGTLPEVRDLAPDELSRDYDVMGAKVAGAGTVGGRRLADEYAITRSAMFQTAYKRVCGAIAVRNGEREKGCGIAVPRDPAHATDLLFAMCALEVRISRLFYSAWFFWDARGFCRWDADNPPLWVVRSDRGHDRIATLARAYMRGLSQRDVPEFHARLQEQVAADMMAHGHHPDAKPPTRDAAILPIDNGVVLTRLRRMRPYRMDVDCYVGKLAGISLDHDERFNVIEPPDAWVRADGMPTEDEQAAFAAHPEDFKCLDQCLDDWSCGIPEVRNALPYVFQYGWNGAAFDQVLFLHAERGSNGKSAVLTLLRSGFGDDAMQDRLISEVPLSKLNDPAYSGELEGKWGNFLDDADSREFLSDTTAFFKTMATHGKMMNRRLYNQASPMRYMGSTVICTNGHVISTDKTGGYNRRIAAITFPADFSARPLRDVTERVCQDPRIVRRMFWLSTFAVPQIDNLRQVPYIAKCSSEFLADGDVFRQCVSDVVEGLRSHDVHAIGTGLLYDIVSAYYRKVSPGPQSVPPSQKSDGWRIALKNVLALNDYVRPRDRVHPGDYLRAYASLWMTEDDMRGVRAVLDELLPDVDVAGFYRTRMGRDNYLHSAPTVGALGQVRGWVIDSQAWADYEVNFVTAADRAKPSGRGPALPPMPERPARPLVDENRVAVRHDLPDVPRPDRVCVVSSESPKDVRDRMELELVRELDEPDPDPDPEPDPTPDGDGTGTGPAGDAGSLPDGGDVDAETSGAAAHVMGLHKLETMDRSDAVLLAQRWLARGCPDDATPADHERALAAARWCSRNREYASSWMSPQLLALADGLVRGYFAWVERQYQDDQDNDQDGSE